MGPPGSGAHPGGVTGKNAPGLMGDSGFESWLAGGVASGEQGVRSLEGRKAFVLEAGGDPLEKGLHQVHPAGTATHPTPRRKRGVSSVCWALGPVLGRGSA